MDTLHRGSRGAETRLLQRLLNKAARADRITFIPLATDGFFGQHTDEALRAFQTRHHLTRTLGTADAATWRTLGAMIEILHPVALVGQPDETSCWAAAASMILGNMSPTIAASHLGPGGHGLSGEVEDHHAFAESLGWMMPMHSPGVGELIQLMRRTPLWVRGGGSDWAHAVVFSGIMGDGTAEGTAVRIHDPWPPRQGRIYGSFLDELHSMTTSGVRVPMSLEYVLIPS